MLLVSSPSNFFALRRLVILLQKRRFGKKYENKQSKASDIYNKIVHYSFSYINYFQGIFRVNLAITNNFCECVGG